MTKADLCVLQDGTLGDARRRRAALAEQEESDDESTSASGSDEDEAEIGVADLDDQALDALSDEEAKEELRRYQAQKLLDESQVVHRPTTFELTMHFAPK